MAIRGKSSGERSAFSARCFSETDEAEASWRARLVEADFPDTRPFLYASAWRSFERATAPKNPQRA
jgi:hypothetical protein